MSKIKFTLFWYQFAMAARLQRYRVSGHINIVGDETLSEAIVAEQTPDSFEQLVAAAKQAYQNAYAPYSQFQVGAAALTAKGNIVSGCNMENASYGLTNCAERNCIAQAVVAGEQQFQYIVIYTQMTQLTPPCGACRQVIAEFLEPDAKVFACNHLGDTVCWRVNQLLPDAFTPKNLNQ
ncbi:cytidine deaminase [Thalassotalea ponticola]|uniref:cytidine deaminase n=1 Tax=Thalassotalea ponticola TaxID=1523392 RepID=UPI0025B3E2B3|nr:cytidine deaminase [Thalassotalea ponticola]MDN3652486.1 cytidine deaminase [Thalassotalea ponticola]